MGRLSTRSEPPARRAVSLPRALSKLGLCSRSQALGLISEGRVSVNGRVSRDASLRVSLEQDRLSVDGAEARETRDHIVIALHKPVGRLDKETSGLLILTDDHRLGEALTNPEGHVPKTYEIGLDKPPDATALESLRNGLDIGKGERTRPAIVAMTDAPAGVRLTMTIHEGRNRQIRRMMAAVGLAVVALRRVSIGDLKLGSLPSGSHRFLDATERKSLLVS